MTRHYQDMARPRNLERRALEEMYRTKTMHRATDYYLAIEGHLTTSHGIGAKNEYFDQELLDHLTAWFDGDSRLNFIRKLLSPN